MNWIERFKIALIEEDEERLSSLVETMPDFADENEMRTAQSLIAQAIGLFEEKRLQIHEEMKRLEYSKRFLTSSSSDEQNRIDLTS